MTNILRGFYRILRLYLYKNKPLIVQLVLGKVGSTSLDLALRSYRTLPYVYVLFLHTNSVFSLKDFLDTLKKRGVKGASDYFLTMDMRLASWLVKQKKRKAKILFPIRSSFDRSISEFFQSPDRYLSPDELKDQNLAIWQKAFIEKFPHAMADDWMAQKEHRFGFSFGYTPFDLSKGYCYFNPEPHIEVLIFNYNMAQNLKTKLIEKFVGIDGLHIEQHNVSQQKQLAPLFKEFREKSLALVPVRSKIDHTRYQKIFFTNNPNGSA